MVFQLKAAADQHLAFARTLTRQAMGEYYREYGLVWSDKGFDSAWAGRESWLIYADDTLLGFISLSRDERALYIRELHVLAAFRRQGAGRWVLEQMIAKARAEGRRLLRLTVFKSNPAKGLYLRLGLGIVGEEACFWRMQLDCWSARMH